MSLTDAPNGVTCVRCEVRQIGEAMSDAAPRLSRRRGQLALGGSRIPLLAVECIRPLRGGSQPYLIRAEDNNYYVIKAQNNPQGLRILANEMLGASLARLLGVPVPPVAVIGLREPMVRLTDDMFIHLPIGKQPYMPGLCFGSLACPYWQVWPPCVLNPNVTENPTDFLGMLVFDKWTGNTDERQVVLAPHDKSGPRALLIDQGFCFGGEEWAFRDKAWQGIASFPHVYDRVFGVADFTPWLDRLEQQITVEMLREAARRIPTEWYRYEKAALEKLIRELDQRRFLVRALLHETLRKAPDRFPNATAATLVAHAGRS